MKKCSSSYENSSNQPKILRSKVNEAVQCNGCSVKNLWVAWNIDNLGCVQM